MNEPITTLSAAMEALRLVLGAEAHAEVQCSLTQYSAREAKVEFSVWNGKRWFEGGTLDHVVRDAIAHAQDRRDEGAIADEAIAGL